MYQLPSGYERSNLLGTVLSLFQPKERKYCLALELIAGKKLFHLVVKDKDCSKPLI